jgi:hypothetical protein
MHKEQLEHLSFSPVSLNGRKTLVSRGMIWELNNGRKVKGLEIEYYGCWVWERESSGTLQRRGSLLRK